MQILNMVRGRAGQSKHVKIKRSVKGKEKWPDFRVDEGRIYTIKVSNQSQYSNNKSKAYRLEQNKRDRRRQRKQKLNEQASKILPQHLFNQCSNVIHATLTN